MLMVGDAVDGDWQNVVKREKKVSYEWTIIQGWRFI
jgi:hypothetical protein